MPDRPVSNNLLDLAPPDIAWFHERSDIVLIPLGSLELVFGREQIREIQ